MEIKPNRFKKTKQPDLFNYHELITVRPEVLEFIEFWNSRLYMPRIFGTDRQTSIIRDALMRPFFREHWRSCIDIIGKSSFLVFKMKPPLTVDWFCDHENFDKILEGKYLDHKTSLVSKKPNTNINHNGDEEIL